MHDHRQRRLSGTAGVLLGLAVIQPGFVLGGLEPFLVGPSGSGDLG